MTFQSLTELKRTVRYRFPTNSIVLTYRPFKSIKNTIYHRLRITIPRRIANETGIDFHTSVDILYDQQTLDFKIKLLKESGGFKVKAKFRKDKKIPPVAVYIETNFKNDIWLPVGAFIIDSYQIKDGLNFKIEQGNGKR